MTRTGLTHRIVLTLALAVLGPPDTLLAQTSERTEGTPASTSTTTRPGARSAWSTQTANPFKLLNKTPSTLQGTQQPGPPTADSQRRRNEKSERINELKQNLESIISEWATATTPQPVPATTEADDTRTTAAPDEKQATSSDPRDGQAPDGATNSETMPPLPGSESGIALSGDVLVDGPVDRVALGDNLYAIGEYTLAMKMYNEADRNSLPRDQQFWVQFQNASCLREIGDLKAAKEQYRVVAGQEDADWLQRSSIWWLDMIDQREELQREIATTQQLLDAERERQK